MGARTTFPEPSTTGIVHASTALTMAVTIGARTYAWTYDDRQCLDPVTLSVDGRTLVAADLGCSGRAIDVRVRCEAEDVPGALDALAHFAPSARPPARTALAAMYRALLCQDGGR